MTTPNNQIIILRRALELERDLIDKRLALLDQYETLEEESHRAPPKLEIPQMHIGGKIPKRKPKKPKGKVAKKMRPRGPQTMPPPRQRASRPKSEPMKPKESGPVKCGGGKVGVKPDSSMEKVVLAIRDRAPRWVSHDGIEEAARAIGLTVPKTFLTTIWKECRELRKGKHDVPGLEYKMVGRRVEYRVVPNHPPPPPAK